MTLRSHVCNSTSLILFRKQSQIVNLSQCIVTDSSNPNFIYVPNQIYLLLTKQKYCHLVKNKNVGFIG